LNIFNAAFVLALALLQSATFAAPTQTKGSPSSVYVCNKCHMKFSAANAKKDHFKDPMDGGTLVAAKASSQKHAKPIEPSGSMGSMGM